MIMNFLSYMPASPPFLAPHFPGPILNPLPIIGITLFKGKTNDSLILSTDVLPVPSSHYTFRSEQPPMSTCQFPNFGLSLMQQVASITPFHWNCSPIITYKLNAKNPWVLLKFPPLPNRSNWQFLTLLLENIHFS